MGIKNLSSQVIIGIAIIAIGILALFNTTGVYDTGMFLQFIPSVFILVGIWALYKSDFRNITGPVILIVIFGTMQLLALDIITGATISSWWPIFIVIVGVAILLNRIRGPKALMQKKVDEVDLTAIFGGMETAVASKSFSGGTITAIFGGVDLDLRDAEISEIPAQINVAVMFGGANIKVPEEWDVKLDVLPLLGGAGDERPRSKKRIENKKEKPDLIVNGFATFGGVTIKD